MFIVVPYIHADRATNTYMYVLLITLIVRRITSTGGREARIGEDDVKYLTEHGRRRILLIRKYEADAILEK